MNETENNFPAANDMAYQVASLQRQVKLLLIALVVISGTLTFYLFYEARTMGTDLAAIEPQARQIIKNYNATRPNLEKFIQQLTAYGQTHPEFQPILRKYGISATNAPAK
jgi:hypothetical protein